jgi:hypothetical protein
VTALAFSARGFVSANHFDEASKVFFGEVERQDTANALMSEAPIDFLQ